MSTALRTYYRGDELVGLRDGQANATRYYHFDHQGTTQCLTDKSSAVTDRFASDAWGVEVKRTGSGINRHWYVGELGYYSSPKDRSLYVRTRHLSVTRAAWTSLDPLSAETSVVSRYSYVFNAPTYNEDPSGLIPRRSVPAPCRPEDLTCSCFPAFPGLYSCHPGGGKIHKVRPVLLNSCYQRACRAYCKRIDEINFWPDLWCSGIPPDPLTWMVNVHFGPGSQVNANDMAKLCPDCPATHPDWRDFKTWYTAGKEDVMGWWFTPCPQECRNRICCFVQTPARNEAMATLRQAANTCYQSSMY